MKLWIAMVSQLMASHVPMSVPIEVLVTHGAIKNRLEMGHGLIGIIAVPVPVSQGMVKGV